jgi:hypothetical protein
LPFVGFLLAVTAASVLMAWVQCNARSGLSAVLFHAAMNTGFAAFGVLTNGRPLFWLTTGVWVLVAVVVYLTTGLRAAGQSNATPAQARSA